ncbi:MAG: TRAP transporter small permease [Candidatus Eiseniibacteriota bacterium]
MPSISGRGATRLRRRVEALLADAVAVGIAALVLMTALQVVLRFVFAAPLSWIEEVSVLLMSWTTWAGAAVLWLRQAHITVDIVPRALAPGARRRFVQVLDVLAFAGGLALARVSVTTAAMFSGVEVGGLELDGSVKYYAVIAGGLGLALAALLNLLIPAERGPRDTAP